VENLVGKVAVITGAGSGIGRALAKACAEEGMRLVLLDLEIGALEETRRACGPATEVLLLTCNVTDENSVDQAAAEVYDRFGNAHLLFNNAGVFTGGPLWASSAKEWRWCLEVNVMGVVNGLRSFIPRMLKNEEPGHIINTASMGGLTSPPHYSVYSASKHAVVALSECLHHDLREVTDRIGVSVLCPSFVKTALSDAPTDALEPLLSPDAVAHRLATRELMAKGRLSAADVARITLEGVKAKRFYILSHPKALASVEIRMRDILDDRSPTNPLTGRP